MKTNKTTGMLAMAAAMLFAGQVLAESKVTSLEDLEGWWRFDDPELAWGCEDQDNQYRVAIGRWEYDAEISGLRFGVGSEKKIGFYDSRCLLQEEKFNGKELIYNSECYTEEGDFSGKTIIKPISRNVISLKQPDGVDLVLLRCPE
ncbi:hypothetical protein U5801_01005 [Lamprobacter modestohalophilus]|uniref:hypothetical protein n=1 Tax=Lamprobacter modestohalophilus TaxID=1064514 RepID=UPI002ADEE980|nr:hypothetical protein [Lamprobacter modestohalophilus]MEA1048402.1 hypothetical protein [Lamprobacter modestohalophilus]